MKEMKAPISYDSYQQSFVYEEHGTFEVGFKVTKLSVSELINISGGFQKEKYFLIVKTLELTNYGVEELNSTEMNQTEGGRLPVYAFIIGVAIGYLRAK